MLWRQVSNPVYDDSICKNEKLPESDTTGKAGGLM